MRFPKRFDGVDTESLPVQLVYIDQTGGLNFELFENMSEFREMIDLTTVVGPFAGEINGDLCVRFETKEACECLSS